MIAAALASSGARTGFDRGLTLGIRYAPGMRRFIAASLLGLMLPQAAIADPAATGDPAPEPESPELGELSQQGTRRGGVEFGLGVVLTGTAVGLIAFGTVQLIRAREHVEFCRGGVTVIDEAPSGGGIDPCVFDPPPLGFASAGLSWGFAIPLAVGGGLLFARGRRILADARAFERVHATLGPWWRRGGGGATLTLHF